MKASAGRIVHYRLQHSGTVRPAIVIETNGDFADLHVFLKPSEKLHTHEYQGRVRQGVGRGEWSWPSHSSSPFCYSPEGAAAASSLPGTTTTVVAPATATTALPTAGECF